MHLAGILDKQQETLKMGANEQGEVRWLLGVPVGPLDDNEKQHLHSTSSVPGFILRTLPILIQLTLIIML